jgi:hypothetical protein
LDYRTRIVEVFVYDDSMNFVSSVVVDLGIDKYISINRLGLISGRNNKIQCVAVSKDNKYGNSLPSNTVELSYKEKLSAPSITINNGLLKVVSSDERSKYYELYVDGNYSDTFYVKEYNLAINLLLETGKHYVFSIKAGAYEYNSSDFSNKVEYKAIGEDFPEYDEPPSDRPDYVGTNATNSVTEYVEAEVYLLEKPDLEWLSKILKQIDGGNTLSIGFYDVLGEYHSIITVVDEYIAGQYGLLYDGKLVCLQNKYTNETRWVEGYMYRYLAITPSQPINTWVIDWFNGNIAQINAYSLKK